MRKNKLKIIGLLFILIHANYRTQTLTEKHLYNVASPEVATLMKYGDFSELDYIGKTNISVPIYDITFGSIKLPINISYNTKGNKVADIATSVGLGWNLTAGGNLTVKVNDQNDFTETYAYYTTSTFEPSQSLSWHRQSKGYLCTDWPDQLFYSNTYGQQLCINHRIEWNDDGMVDAAPDFFHINAPGFSDKFYLTRINETQFKANFFKSTNAKLNNNLILTITPTCGGYESTYWGSSGKASVFYKPDKFEITGENGYIYTFNDYETSRITEYPQDFFSHDAIQVNNWYLTKMKDPISGREIVFEYESYVNNYEHPSLTTLEDVNFGNYNVVSNYVLGSNSSIYEAPPLIYNKVTTSKLTSKRLKKILTDEETVDFTYAFNRDDYPGNGLTNISIKNKNGAIIKKTDFQYSYFNSENCSGGNYECKRLKLNNITDSSSGTYTFYYDSNNFPPRNSSKVDFLGYYNNNSSNITFSKDNFHPYENYFPTAKTYFYPDLTNDNILPFRLVNKAPYFEPSGGVDKTPSVISKMGLLQRIVYPTGGSLSLSYENDDFMYEGVQYILGSTRINNMKLYDSQNQISREVKYKYINENNTSSGQINFITTPVNVIRTEISPGIGFNTGAIVGYSRIVEEETGKGSIEKKYSNFSDYPDKFMESETNFTDQGVKNLLKFLKFPHSYVQSFDDRRGQLLSANYYKEGISSPIKSEVHTYDYHVKDSLKVRKAFSSYLNSGYNMTESYFASNYLLRYFNNKSSITKEDFFSGSSIKEENFFNYDDSRLIYKKTLSSGNITEEYYRNAKDKSTQKLIDANIFDKTVEYEKKKNGKTLIKQEVKYENPNIFPSSEFSYDMNVSLMEKEVNYDKYDSKGNLLQYTQNSGIPVTIIWGYRQSQPIVKIEGATYSQIMQLFGLNANDNNSYLDLEIVKKSNLHFDTSTETDLFSKLNEFRSNSQLKEFKITTYTHAPLIGVKSITSASGLKESYLYDTSNRLEKVVNSEGKTLKEYKYNYAPATYYSALKTQTFTRNNCGGNAVGGSYTYTVPAGQYTSILSQTDADQKAADDVNTNGQNVANANGTCTPFTCNLSFNSSIGISGGGSVSAQSNGYYKVSFGFSSGSNSVNLPWTTTGVKVATISGVCKPTTDYSSYNGQVYYTIKTNGDIILRSQSTAPSNNTSYNYEIIFPIN